MMRNVFGVLAILALLPLLLLSVKWASRRWHFPAELKRKAVHVGMGLSTLSFPWIFTSVWAVAALGVLSVLALALVKRLEARSGGDSVLHAVDRESHGDILFPTAVVTVFWWADGDWLFYVIPILILTLADAAGALIGTRYGRTKFAVLEGWKSLEGSALFFFTAFLSVHVPLLLFSGLGRAETLLISVILALVVMLFEAITTHGWDNLVIPLSSAYLLRIYSEMSASDLVWRLLFVIGMMIAILLTRKHTSLQGAGLMAMVLLAYACLACGDWRYLIPPVLLFIEHLMVTKRLRRVSSPKHDLYPVLSIGLSLLPWLLAARFNPDERAIYLGVITIAVTIHLAALNLATRVFVNHHRSSPRMIRLSLAKSALLIAVPGWLLVEQTGMALVSAGLTAMLAAAALLVFVFAQGNPMEYSNGRTRWALQGVVAILGAVPGLWFPIFR